MLKEEKSIPPVCKVFPKFSHYSSPSSFGETRQSRVCICQCTNNCINMKQTMGEAGGEEKEESNKHSKKERPRRQRAREDSGLSLGGKKHKPMTAIQPKKCINYIENFIFIYTFEWPSSYLWQCNRSLSPAASMMKIISVESSECLNGAKY